MARSTDEWIGKHDDETIPPRVKLRVFDAHQGKCAHCTRSIGGSLRAVYDHIIALINGGENRESNLQLLCVQCHADKTGRDVAEKSMIHRKRKAHLGLRKPRRITRWRNFKGELVTKPRDR